MNENLLKGSCEACRIDAPKVTNSEIESLMPQIPSWSILENDEESHDDVNKIESMESIEIKEDPQENEANIESTENETLESLESKEVTGTTKTSDTVTEEVNQSSVKETTTEAEVKVRKTTIA